MVRKFFHAGAAVIGYALLTACGGHGHSILPSAVNVSNTVRALQGVAANGQRRLVFNPDLGGRSADNAYALRSLHVPGVGVRESLSYVTPGGTFTQVTYTTPYGPLTLVQSPKRPDPPADVQAAAMNVPADQQLQVVASGKAHGAQWLIIQEPKSRSYDVTINFKDSVIDGSVPSSLPLATIEGVIGELY